MTRSLKSILIICSVFGLFYIFDKIFFQVLYRAFENIIHVYPVSFFFTYLIVGTPIFLYSYFLKRSTSDVIYGLNKNIGKGILLSLLYTFPMFLGYGVLTTFSVNISWGEFWLGCVFAAFFEELYYRGFFFGELYKTTNLGFLPIVVLNALFFASLHLYQSNEPAILLGVFITTFMGAVFFSWLYVEWNFNLWIPIGLHFFMNLSWTLFSISDNALGNLPANLLRAATIALAIIVTIYLKKRNHESFFITKKNLFWNYSLS